MENHKPRGGMVEMSFIPSVQTRNVVVSNVMMSSAPKNLAKNDVSPHTQIPCFHARGNTTNVCKQTISIVDIALDIPE